MSMKNLVDDLLHEQMELQIAPLIDMVFLMLIYFMVAASLMKQEADLGISLPGLVPQSQVIKMPDEQIIVIGKDGNVELNGRIFGSPDKRELPELKLTLARFREAAESANTKAMVTIQADDDVEHARVVDVMNACAGAGIVHVTFGMGGS
ncbi:MAG: biopolymer transporter ExbD [Kiritimatiellae bacterium]|nr:biopolymer transporter ExbD [Kiritimatiellia bacterium]